MRNLVSVVAAMLLVACSQGVGPSDLDEHVGNPSTPAPHEEAQAAAPHASAGAVATAAAEVDPDVDEKAASEATPTSHDSLRGNCFCTGSFACGHSSSASFMFPEARTALGRSGVSEASLTQTYGDAPASVGTHCPEPGTTHSGATDIAAGDDPCGRTRALRRQGFAAFYRTAPEFPGNEHIHAVFAGASPLKGSLQRQIASFLDGHNGLASDGFEDHCPITESEKAAVRGGGSVSTGCVPGSNYCGGDKLVGDGSSLYRCNSDGSATFITQCGNGCSVNSGDDDACR